MPTTSPIAVGRIIGQLIGSRARHTAFTTITVSDSEGQLAAMTWNPTGKLWASLSRREQLALLYAEFSEDHGWLIPPRFEDEARGLEALKFIRLHKSRWVLTPRGHSVRAAGSRPLPGNKDH